MLQRQYGLLFLMISCLSGLVACKAQGPCSQYFTHSYEVEACQRGAEKIAPNCRSYDEVRRACDTAYDVRSIEIPPSDPNWFKEVSEKADAYTACYCGAAARLYVEFGIRPTSDEAAICGDFFRLRSALGQYQLDRWRPVSPEDAAQ